MLKRPSNEKTGPANTKQVKRSSLPEQEHVSAYDPLAYDILKQHNCYWTFKQFENSAQVYVSGNDDDRATICSITILYCRIEREIEGFAVLQYRQFFLYFVYFNLGASILLTCRMWVFSILDSVWKNNQVLHCFLSVFWFSSKTYSNCKLHSLCCSSWYLLKTKYVLQCSEP